tara:strand:+ start:918 stop:3233 length:2316 start_codon:yes stop_codon:yes gene_type:complete
MEKVEFESIHNVVIDCLNKENDNNLEVIGLWYYRFLKSETEKLSLYLPFYSIEFTKLAYTYVRLFTVAFNLLKQNKLIDFKGTCLFDIFNKQPRTEIGLLTLDFSEQKDNLALWGEDTLTKLDQFLPVFNKEELVEFDEPKTIENTFQLFKSIRNANFINHPVLISIEERMLSFNSIDKLDDQLISEKLFLLNTRLKRKEAIHIKKELSSDFKNGISVKYPYSLKPTFPLTEIGDKKFKLVFNNRFAYNDILEEDLYLLQDEAKLSTQLTYNIVDTKHSAELYELFKRFREQWVNLELNKYTTPFPKYWFLFLNNSLPAEEWLSQFKKDFPAVAEKPIIKIVKNIINEIIKINWIKDEITDSTKILFPELKSNRKKRLEFIYNNFKNYIITINQKVEFISSVDSNNYENVIVLDSFNIIDLVNKNQFKYKDAINIVVPDFLYFGYQPWIKYHLFNYQFTPLLIGLREQLDTDFGSNKKVLEELKNKIVKEIKTEFKYYREKYKVEIQKEETFVESNEKQSLEDIEFTNEEEIENTNPDKESNNKSVIINQNLENEVTISSTEKILLQKDTLLYVKARSLRVTDLIIRNNDILNLFKADVLYDNLVNIPSSVLNYQTQLFSKKNVYKALKNRAISYQNQSYFDANYVIDEIAKKDFRIPKRKKDWKIICDFLNIDHSAQQLAFIAYYGRSKQNELKKMYKSIIDLLLENNWLGSIEDPNIVASVSDLVYQYNSIFKTNDTIEIREISESVITTILDQLKFTEIKTIKTIENE